MPQPRRQAAMVFIVVTLLLDVIGLGIIIPVLPHLVEHMLGDDASRAAEVYGLLASSYAVMQFLFAPVLGALSDRFGRRPVLLVALFGFGINYLIMGFAPSIFWLFLARILSGVTGASITTANAYIADISTPQNRSQNFGLVGAMFGIGFIIGPAVGGVLGHFGPRVPFFAAAAVVFANFLYGLLVLPESLAVEHRRPFKLTRANPLIGVLSLGRFKLVAGLALAFTFASLAQRGLETVWVLYTSYRYGWHELENGLALALVGVTAAIVQGGLIRKIMPVLGERRAVVAGLSLSLISMVLYGLASQSWMMLAVVAVSALGGISMPAIQGLVAGSVPPSEQGSVQGTLTSLMSLTAIAAPLISSQLFAFFTRPTAPLQLPGAPFFAGALFVSLALVTSILVFRRIPATAPSPADLVPGAAAEAGPAS
ncbi:MAG: TCR/Tet family MFS transporter [Pseudomonadota bacterium]